MSIKASTAISGSIGDSEYASRYLIPKGRRAKHGASARGFVVYQARATDNLGWRAKITPPNHSDSEYVCNDMTLSFKCNIPFHEF